jgi:hypothetical protein
MNRPAAVAALLPVTDEAIHPGTLPDVVDHKVAQTHLRPAPCGMTVVVMMHNAFLVTML